MRHTMVQLPAASQYPSFDVATIGPPSLSLHMSCCMPRSKRPLIYGMDRDPVWGCVETAKRNEFDLEVDTDHTDAKLHGIECSIRSADKRCRDEVAAINEINLAHNDFLSAGKQRHNDRRQFEALFERRTKLLSMKMMTSPRVLNGTIPRSNTSACESTRNTPGRNRAIGHCQ